MSDYNFDVKGRLPVVPLSLEFKELATPKELIVDYKNGDIFVVTETGDIVNICASTTTMEAFAKYLSENPDIVETLVVTVPDKNKPGGYTTDTIKNVLDYMYSYIDTINSRTFNYAKSDVDGGAALAAKKLVNALTIRTDSGSTTYDGSTPVSVNLNQYYSANGGEVNGDMKLLGNLVLSKDQMYGTELPNSGVEGQLFFLILDD